MGILRFLAAMAVLCASALAETAPAVSEDETVPQRGEASGDEESGLAALVPFIDGYAAAELRDGYPPALMIAVATPQDSLTRIYGLADARERIPADAETLFRIASISKTFVWVSVMMMVEEGRIDLDADVNSYLTGFQIPDAFDAPVTMDDLMAHRAGFEDTVGGFFESHTGRTQKEMLIRHMPKRVAPPGVRSSYSNWGTGLAAHIVSEVSGLPFDVFVNTRILTPLAMTSTTMRDPATAALEPRNPPSLDARMAAPHKREAGAAAPTDYTRVEPNWPAGAFAISARDAVRWMQFLMNEGSLDGAQLLAPETFRLMRTRAFDDRPTAPDFARGFMEAEVAGTKTFGHGGTLSGFISNMTIAPELGLGVFVVANGAEPGRIPDQVARAVIEAYAGRPATGGAPPDAVAGEAAIAAAKEIAGVYAGTRRIHSKFEKIGALGGETTIVARDDGSISVASGGAVSRYYLIADDLWSDGGRGRLYVNRDRGGRVVRLSGAMGTNSYEKVGPLSSTQAFVGGLVAIALLTATQLLSAWRRAAAPFSAGGFGGRASGAAGLAMALAWAGYLALFGLTIMSVSSVDIAEAGPKGWPPAIVDALRWSSIGIFAVSLLSLAILVQASAGRAWRPLRKLHFAAFTLAGFFMIYQLYEWRVLFAPVTRT